MPVSVRLDPKTEELVARPFYPFLRLSLAPLRLLS